MSCVISGKVDELLRPILWNGHGSKLTKLQMSYYARLKQYLCKWAGHRCWCIFQQANTKQIMFSVKEKDTRTLSSHMKKRETSEKDHKKWKHSSPLMEAWTYLLILFLHCWHLPRSVPEVRWNEPSSKAVLKKILFENMLKCWGKRQLVFW